MTKYTLHFLFMCVVGGVATAAGQTTPAPASTTPGAPQSTQNTNASFAALLSYQNNTFSPIAAATHDFLEIKGIFGGNKPTMTPGVLATTTEQRTTALLKYQLRAKPP